MNMFNDGLSVCLPDPVEASAHFTGSQARRMLAPCQKECLSTCGRLEDSFLVTGGSSGKGGHREQDAQSQLVQRLAVKLLPTFAWWREVGRWPLMWEAIEAALRLIRHAIGDNGVSP